jgi:hypothetical protein
MIEFLPEREDLVMWFDTENHRVFVTEEVYNDATRWEIEIINDADETVLREETYNDEQSVYQVVSEFLADE